MATATISRQKTLKPAAGRFGVYGGRYVPETLMAALEELEQAYEKAKRDRRFQQRLDHLLRSYAGRPTPLFFAERFTNKLGGAKIYLKREDLLHTGAHKINNCIGQGLLVERMGKKRVIAETGAGQHGVATATVCALLGFECVVYMGTEDMRRQELNVFRMRLLGAEVRGVKSGSRTLKDAINEAMRDWVTNVHTTHYLLGSVLGAHPYPTMVRDFHRVIGREARAQILKAKASCQPRSLLASAADRTPSAFSTNFFEDKKVAADRRRSRRPRQQLGDHAARFQGGTPGVLQGTYSTSCRMRAGRSRSRTRSPRDWTTLDRPRARLAERSGPRRVHLRLRRGSAGSHEGTCPHRRNYSGAGIRARRRRGHQARTEDEEVGNFDREHLRTRRQRHRDHARELEARLKCPSLTSTANPLVAYVTCGDPDLPARATSSLPHRCRLGRLSSWEFHSASGRRRPRNPACQRAGTEATHLHRASAYPGFRDPPALAVRRPDYFYLPESDSAHGHEEVLADRPSCRGRRPSWSSHLPVEESARLHRSGESQWAFYHLPGRPHQHRRPA